MLASLHIWQLLICTSSGHGVVHFVHLLATKFSPTTLCSGALLLPQSTGLEKPHWLTRGRPTCKSPILSRTPAQKGMSTVVISADITEHLATSCWERGLSPRSGTPCMVGAAFALWNHPPCCWSLHSQVQVLPHYRASNMYFWSIQFITKLERTKNSNKTPINLGAWRAGDGEGP